MTLQNADHFLYLINRYEAKLFRYIKRLAKVTDQDAEDILQEVFIKTYENLNAFNPSLKFSSWIYRITHNHVISHFRKSKPETLSEEDNLIIFENLTSDTNIKKELDQKLQKERLCSLLKELDKKYRDVLILKFLEDKDYKEISDILKKPMGTIATLLNRAKSKFKKLLIKHNLKL